MEREMREREREIEKKKRREKVGIFYTNQYHCSHDAVEQSTQTAYKIHVYYILTEQQTFISRDVKMMCSNSQIISDHKCCGVTLCHVFLRGGCY